MNPEKPDENLNLIASQLLNGLILGGQIHLDLAEELAKRLSAMQVASKPTKKTDPVVETVHKNRDSVEAVADLSSVWSDFKNPETLKAMENLSLEEKRRADELGALLVKESTQIWGLTKPMAKPFHEKSWRQNDEDYTLIPFKLEHPPEPFIQELNAKVALSMSDARKKSLIPPNADETNGNAVYVMSHPNNSSLKIVKCRLKNPYNSSSFDHRVGAHTFTFVLPSNSTLLRDLKTSDGRLISWAIKSALCALNKTNLRYVDMPLEGTYDTFSLSFVDVDELSTYHFPDIRKKESPIVNKHSDEIRFNDEVVNLKVGIYRGNKSQDIRLCY